jgi:hypothetical protein
VQRNVTPYDVAQSLYNCFVTTSQLSFNCCNRFAVALRSLCGRFAVTLRSLCGRFAVALRSLCGHFAIPHLTKQFLCQPHPTFTNNSHDTHHITENISMVKRLGWRVLETYEEDKKAFGYHIGMKAGSSKLLDCTHWLVPGVPDVWTAKLLNVLDDLSATAS